MTPPVNPPPHIAAKLAHRNQVANDWYSHLEEHYPNTVRLFGMTREIYVQAALELWSKTKPLTWAASNADMGPIQGHHETT